MYRRKITNAEQEIPVLGKLTMDVRIDQLSKGTLNSWLSKVKVADDEDRSYTWKNKGNRLAVMHAPYTYEDYIYNEIMRCMENFDGLGVSFSSETINHSWYTNQDDINIFSVYPVISSLVEYGYRIWKGKKVSFDNTVKIVRVLYTVYLVIYRILPQMKDQSEIDLDFGVGNYILVTGYRLVEDTNFSIENFKDLLQILVILDYNDKVVNKEATKLNLK